MKEIIVPIVAILAFIVVIGCAVQSAGNHDIDDAQQSTGAAQLAADAARSPTVAHDDGRMTVKSPSYACDSRFEASMFVLMSKGAQYAGNSDVNAMFENDVHQGDCKRLYPGDAMIITSDRQVDDKDLSVVKFQGNDHEYFTPTALLTQIDVSTPAPPPSGITADMAPAPVATADPAAAGYGNDSYDDAPVIKAEVESYRDTAKANVRGTINHPVEACQSHGGNCVTLQPGTKVILDVPGTDENTAWFAIASPTGDQPRTLVSANSSAVTLD